MLGKKAVKKRITQNDRMCTDQKRAVEAVPEGMLAERIDGRLYIVERPKRWHQRIVRILKEMIEDYRKSHAGFCEIRTAPFGAALNGDEATWLIPDISVILEEEKITEKGCVGAPELVIEVVAPETQYMDYRIKLARYRSAGVKEYWIVDRDWDHGYVYYFDDGDMDLAAFSGALRSRVCDGLVIDFSKLKQRK